MVEEKRRASGTYWVMLNHKWKALEYFDDKDMWDNGLKDENIEKIQEYRLKNPAEIISEDIKTVLTEKLKYLSQKFPYITIKYGFNPLADSHIVQLTPEHEYNNNTELDDEWFKIVDELLRSHRNEHVAFVTSSSDLLTDDIPLIYTNLIKQHT